MRKRMQERGLSEAEIDARIEQMRAGGGQGPGGGGPAAAGGTAAPAGIPPFMAERIKNATPDELEKIKQRMKQFGMSDERINEVVKQVRGGDGGSP
jgi:hypothetical protein